MAAWLALMPCVWLVAAVEARVGWQQACAGGGLLGVCHAGGGGMHRAGALPGIHPGDPRLRFLQVPGQSRSAAQIRFQ